MIIYRRNSPKLKPCECAIGRQTVHGLFGEMTVFESFLFAGNWRTLTTRLAVDMDWISIVCISDSSHPVDISMDIMLAHLLIKMTTCFVSLYIFLSFVLTLYFLVRLSGTIVREGLMFHCSLFFSSRDLRGPWVDLREILPHRRKHAFTNAGPKILGPSP